MATAWLILIMPYLGQSWRPWRRSYLFVTLWHRCNAWVPAAAQLLCCRRLAAAPGAANCSAYTNCLRHRHCLICDAVVSWPRDLARASRMHHSWRLRVRLVCFCVQSTCRLLSRPYYGNISNLFFMYVRLYESVQETRYSSRLATLVKLWEFITNSHGNKSFQMPT